MIYDSHILDLIEKGSKCVSIESYNDITEKELYDYMYNVMDILYGKEEIIKFPEDLFTI